MAKVGDRLLQPEEGWVRYDDDDDLIVITGMTKTSGSSYYNGTSTYQSGSGVFSIYFRFYGSKLRVIGSRNSGYSNQIKISIDDRAYTFSPYHTSQQTQILLYENLDLELGFHDVVISRGTSGYYHFDAVDVDGKLVPLIEEANDISNLGIGKRIRCNYTATRNAVGILSGFGKETGEFINPRGTVTPDGDFYLICCGETNGQLVLVADRNIQTGVSWNQLNDRGLDSGVPLESMLAEEIINPMPDMDDYIKEGFEVSASSFYGSDYPWRAFTDNSGSSRDFWYASTSSPYPHWIQVEMDQPRKINAVEMIPILVSSTNYDYRYSLKDWILEGSNDGDNFEKLLSGRHINNQETAFYSFSNEEYFKYYRLVILNSHYGNYNVGLRRLKFYELQGNSISGQVRLLSGGKTQDDGNNEWDKIIVNSSLDGTIFTGYNGIWNWQGVWSWCQEENPSNVNQRVLRGNNSVDGFTYSSPGNGYGFRPTIFVNGFFVQISNRFYSVARGKDLGLKFNVYDEYYKDNKWIYTIFVDDVKIYESDKFVSSQEINYNIPFRYLSDSIEEKKITVEIKSDRDIVVRDTVIAKLVNHSPKIEAILKANELSLHILDEDSDHFSYRILINDRELEYRAVTSSSIKLKKIISSTHLNIEEENTITIIATDSYGGESKKAITFIGEYSGLMFSDMDEEFYSTDIGEVLKYLMTDTMMAGTSSFVYPIKLTNKYPFKVTNFRLWANEKDLEGVSIQFSEEEVPFIAKTELTDDTEMDYGDGIVFYIRVTSNPSTMGGGVFDIYVKADPV